MISPDPHSGEVSSSSEAPEAKAPTGPHPRPSLAFGRARGASAPVMKWGPNLGPPKLFSRGYAPACMTAQIDIGGRVGGLHRAQLDIVGEAASQLGARADGR